MRKIKLTQGKWTMVDDEDYDELNQWKWFAQLDRKVWYAKRNIPRKDGSQYTFPMHRAVMQPTEKLEVNHKNGNGLDNRRKNLENITHAQNCQRIVSRHKLNKSGFIGVFWNKVNSKWKAVIVRWYKRTDIGYFPTARSASMARTKYIKAHNL